MPGIDCFADITGTPVLLIGVLLAGVMMVGRGNATRTNKGGNNEPTY